MVYPSFWVGYLFAMDIKIRNKSWFYFFVKRGFDIFNSLLLILSGGIGNLIDRLFRGAVVDFIDVGYKEVYRWPAFNVADSCVCIGVTLFVITLLFFNKKKS